MNTTDSKVAVVTGAARGIGLAIAEWFLAHEHRVALLDIDGDTLDATAARLGSGADDNARVLPLHCDVSAPAPMHKAFAAVDGGFDATGIGLPGLRTP
jgi:meso-butanediol dehydrogenase / (S,S)-butanediol dehydrogenase / diacetyl reductase